MKKIAFAFVVAATFAAVPAFAQDATATATATAAPAAASGGEKEFGNPGVLNFGAATGLNFGYTSISPPNGAPSSNKMEFSLTPQIQYFVAEGISVGGEVLFDYSKPKDVDATTTWGIGPTVGYNLWLQPGSLSLWPQIEFLYKSSSTTISAGTTSVSGTLSQGTLGVFVPVLIHPVKHFHFGVGPYLALDVISKESAGGTSVDGTKNTIFGIKAEIAGWL